jgi:hypothetical protein
MGTPLIMPFSNDTKEKAFYFKLGENPIYLKENDDLRLGMLSNLERELFKMVDGRSAIL